MSEETETKGFKKWYDKNKAALNAKRTQRYSDDPEYREKIKERARVASAKRRAENKGKVTREMNGVQVEVVKMRDVAALCGIDPETIRKDESKGHVPKMSFKGSHRVYTLKQRDLLVKFYAGTITQETVASEWE